MLKKNKLRNSEFHWYSEEKKVIHRLTAEKIIEFLKDEKKESKVIDIGCGFAEVDKIISQKTDYQIYATDISKNALKIAKENLKNTNVKTKREDVFNMSFKDNEFDIAISTGYCSAANLPGAVDEVSRIVKKDGVIILDYQRYYNVYYLLTGGFFKRLQKYLSGDSDYYYFGSVGLKKYFEKKRGLKIEKISSFYTYPPYMKKAKNKRLFEKTIGWLLRPFFARVVLVKLRNTKK